LGSAIFTIISAVAQLERDVVAERVKAGLRRAVENGKKLGRPKGPFMVKKSTGHDLRG
jgi:DNA invertase Pin-like site-specific DNA recombinase